MPATIESQTVNSITPQSSPNNANSKISIKGLPVASFVKNIEDNGWTKTYTYYDQKARPIGTHSDNYLGGYTRTATKLKFSGKPEYTLTYHKKADRSDVTTIKETFEYDNQERVTKHWHQVNNTGNNELLAENIYNEIGQLQSKKVGGNATTPLQTVDYGYNIRGWMTGINAADASHQRKNHAEHVAELIYKHVAQVIACTQKLNAQICANRHRKCSKEGKERTYSQNKLTQHFRHKYRKHTHGNEDQTGMKQITHRPHLP